MMKTICARFFELLGAAADRAQAAAEIKKWGIVNPEIVCRQCQKPGRVRILPLKRKTGISGGKVMGALVTGGVSLLATGLSRKQLVTQAHCDNCNSTWDF